jgi:uncharacterized protein (UPF0261 family)
MRVTSYTDFALRALMRLPVGVPKIVVSPIASGRHEFGPLVGTRDMMVVHSVVDILGLNEIACTVFDNVAAAMAGMLVSRETPVPAERAGSGPRVGITMLGNTTTAVMALRDVLGAAGLRTLVFHSNGVGGRAMEELAHEGHLEAVVDFTTNEVTDPLVGGIHDGGPDRLRRVGQLGLPQVIVPGCVDFSVFHTGAVPPALADRPVYDHNPEYTLVRTSRAEMLEIARIFAERLGRARGPVTVAVPTRGLSIPNVPGGPFWDPDGDGAFVDALRRELPAEFPVHTFDLHVNDPRLGEQVADLFVQQLDQEQI